LIPALLAVALMLLWSVHDGGFDADTWYWGALAMLSLLAVTVLAVKPWTRPLRRSAVAGLAAFGAYVAWSYGSMTWAQTPGQALDGSNRALLYLLVFALFLILPWTARAALLALLAYAGGVIVIAIVLLARLASGYQLGELVIQGRLAAPTGYFNSTVALFMFGTLLATALASRRELPAPIRGFLLAGAAASLQLCMLGQSRGWLFTLPLVLVIAVALVRDRLRVAAHAILPVAAVLLPVHRLLGVFKGGNSGAAMTAAAQTAAHTSLELCVAVLVVGTLAAWFAPLLSRQPSVAVRRLIGAGVTALALAAALGGGVVATGGHPLRFVEAQWNGFSHQEPSTPTGGSHFAAIGSGRYDFWRVALDAFRAHPLAGIGQDNFADYYILRRRTTEDPLWPHSLELRLLAMTGIVGFLLFAVFLVGAIAAALRARRATGLSGALAAAALLPLVVWLVHGSIDWFFEMPALSGPALGFLGMAASLSVPRAPAPARVPAPAQRRGPVLASVPAVVVPALAVALLAACTVALAFPYLSVREVSEASDAAGVDPTAALHDLSVASRLDPWSPEPDRLAGQIALLLGSYQQAERDFRRTVAREPGGWYGWLGAGLAASALGDATQAARDLHEAAVIDNQDPVIRTALARVLTTDPLAPAKALAMLSAESGV